VELAQNKKAAEAEAALKAEIDKVEQLNLYNDGHADYYDFNTLMEMVMFQTQHPEIQPVADIEEPLNRLYAMYGSILLEQGKLDEAEEALAIAMDWNPMSAAIAFEHAEVFKQKKDWEKFKGLTVAVFSIAYKRKEIAHCYRNLGYYFVEKQMWDEAVGCYLLSMSFADAEGRYQAELELKYIHEETEGQAQRPSIGALRSYGEKYGFPVGPDAKIIETAMQYGKSMLANKKYEHANYFLDIAYKLTENKELKVLLDKINVAMQ
jgi:tetratricopeptide (TPR) repeat protein